MNSLFKVLIIFVSATTVTLAKKQTLKNTSCVINKKSFEQAVKKNQYSKHKIIQIKKSLESKNFNIESSNKNTIKLDINYDFGLQSVGKKVFHSNSGIFNIALEKDVYEVSCLVRLSMRTNEKFVTFMPIELLDDDGENLRITEFTFNKTDNKETMSALKYLNCTGQPSMFSKLIESLPLCETSK